MVKICYKTEIVRLTSSELRFPHSKFDKKTTQCERRGGTSQIGTYRKRVLS